MREQLRESTPEASVRKLNDACLLLLQAKVMSGLHTKLKALEQELEAEETQQKAIVEKKNEALAKLEAAKEEREAGQADYR